MDTKLMCKTFKKRRAWQLAFKSTTEKTKFTFTADIPSTFYALRFYVSPRDCEILVLEQDDKPVSDSFGNVLNREWFARWKTPLAFSDSESDTYELQRNGVQLYIEKGDVITLNFDKGCQSAALVGFIEEE